MRSYLAKHQPQAPADAEQLDDLRRAAWHKQGVVVIDPVTVRDDFARRAILNEAERLYGKRREHGKG
jgi:hypothetical protein